MQMTVRVGSRLHGVYLPELRLPPDAAVVLIVREGRSFVPDRTTQLRRGDQALLVAARRARPGERGGGGQGAVRGAPRVAAGGRAPAAGGEPGRAPGELARRDRHCG